MIYECGAEDEIIRVKQKKKKKKQLKIRPRIYLKVSSGAIRPLQIESDSLKTVLISYQRYVYSQTSQALCNTNAVVSTAEANFCSNTKSPQYLTYR